jgi:hypothetical protein
MRRPSGHIRERSPGSWELRYSLGTDPATGKRRTGTKTVLGSRRAAEQELRRALTALEDGEHVQRSRTTLRVWLAKWLETVRHELSPKTHERYSEIVNNFLVPALGGLLLTKIGPTHIQEAYNAWAEGGRRDGKTGGLSPLTRHYFHVVLRSSLNRALEQQLITRNPADVSRKRLPKVERREMVTLSTEQSPAFSGRAQRLSDLLAGHDCSVDRHEARRDFGIAMEEC